MPRKYSGPLQPGKRSAYVPKGRPVRFKRPAKPAKAIQSYVKKQIHLNLENKYAAVTVLPTQIPAYIGSNANAGNIFTIMPSITRGTEPDQRVGAKITPRYLIIKGYLTLDMNDTTQDYDRICVRLIVGFSKRNPRSTDALQKILDSPDANWTNKIIKNGSIDSPFDGTLQALQSPVNRTVFTVKGQRFLTMSRPRFYDAPLVGSDSFRYSGNSTRFFTMKIKCPKTVHYDIEGNSGYPEDFSPVLMAGYSLLNGASPGLPSATIPKPVTISYTTRFSYEDA